MNIIKYRKRLLWLSILSALPASFLFGNRSDLLQKIIAWDLAFFAALLAVGYLFANSRVKKTIYFFSWFQVAFSAVIGWVSLYNFLNWFNTPSLHQGAPFFLIPIAFIFAFIPAAMICLVAVLGLIVCDLKNPLLVPSLENLTNVVQKTDHAKAINKAVKFFKIAGILNLSLGGFFLLGALTSSEADTLWVFSTALLITGSLFLLFSKITQNILLNLSLIILVSIASIVFIFGIPSGALAMLSYLKLKKVAADLNFS